MKPVNNKIIVRVDLEQKNSFLINGIKVSTANKFATNYREKSPTIAEVVEGNEWVNEGDVLLCHHNLFYLPSPYHLYENLFSVPASNVLFAVIQSDGNLKPIYGNVLCDRVDIESEIPLPPELRKKYSNRSIVKDGGNTGYKKGQLVFHRPFANYDINYMFNGIETITTKVHSDQICGIVK